VTVMTSSLPPPMSVRVLGNTPVIRMIGFVAVALLVAGCGGGFDVGEIVWDLTEEAKIATWTPEGAGPLGEVVIDGELVPALSLAAGQRVDYYLRIPNGSRLTIDRCVASSPGGMRASVTFQRAGDSEVEVAEVAPSSKTRVFFLPDGITEIARLTLTAHEKLSSASTDSPSELVLWVPQIRVNPRAVGEPDEVQEPVATKTEFPNIVIYLVDTLRADHLGIYGYDRPTSPNLDVFAEGATVFHNAIAQSSWTKPSIASIFTGLDAEVHGVVGTDSVLPDSLTTIAEVLSDKGYFAVGVYTNHVIGEKFDFGQGFDRWEKVGQRVNKNTDRILSERDPIQPTFLYVHTMRPHSPYRPAKEFKERFAAEVPEEFGDTEFLKGFRSQRAEPEVERGVKKLYDGEIASNDRQFGEFLELLRRHDLFDDSLIIFLSDHGEELWDHAGWGHGHTLYRELIRVPFVLRAPSNPRTGRVDALVALTDVLPTVLDYAGIGAPPGLPGRSLRLIDEIPRHRVAVARVVTRGDDHGELMVSVQDDCLKLIQMSGRDGSIEVKLFDLEADPHETKNLSTSQPIIVNYLKAHLARHQLLTQEMAVAENVPLDDETIEQLRELGYLD